MPLSSRALLAVSIPNWRSVLISLGLLEKSLPAPFLILSKIALALGTTPSEMLKGL